jgi:2-iminobutanoate/2-iminopropanoate deaminase
MAQAPFSDFIKVNEFIYTSGKIALNPDGKLVQDSVESETKQVMENLKTTLEKAGVTFTNVIKTTIYMTDMSMYGKINEVYATYMSNPFPAREAVCVKELPLGARIEISMIVRSSEK